MRLPALLLAFAFASPTQAAVALTDWLVPWPDTRPRDPDVAPDGSVWFVGQVGNYLARLDPATGRFERVDLPAKTKPHNLIVDDEGRVWFAGNGDAYIGRYEPETKAFVRYAMPDPAAKDPHTLVFDGRGGI